MNLADIFAKVVHKQLVAVELPEGISNAHEMNGTAALKNFFGVTGQLKGQLQWHYFADDHDPVSEPGTFTFYDARAKSASRTGRSEWRFYYDGDFLSRADVGDWVFLARTHDDRLFALVFEDNSAWLRAAKVLFGVHASSGTFDEIEPERLGRQQLELLHRQIVEELGIDVAVPVPRSDEQLMLETFGEAFPTTATMSAFARTQIDVDIRKADASLLAWLDREEQLFRALESAIIRKRLDEGFTTVDDFVSYSLSVQNRRKSRMGHALQNHLAEIFTQHSLRYAPQCRTEGKSRPDFIFPGHAEYHDPAFAPSLLVMLGVKSSSKERWRQVLDEADRIPRKHLCTLDQGVSIAQTEAMRNRNLTLVVPAGLHATYSDNQVAHMLTIESFIDLVRRNQNAPRGA